MSIRRVSRAIVIIATTSLLVTGLSFGASATRPACRVKNTTQDTWFATQSGAALTHAIAEADAGDRLNVLGTCVGSFSISKELTLAGNRRWGRATLSGGGAARVIELNVGANVTIMDLTVTGGNAGIGGGGGMAVYEGATATLRRVKVLANTTTNAGGGIVNGGDLRLYNSRVSRNHSEIDGGGIYNYGDLLLEGSTLYGNTAVGGGGG